MRPIWILIFIIIGLISSYSNNAKWLDEAQEKSEQKFKNANQNIIDASRARANKERKQTARQQWLKENGKEEIPLKQEPKWYPSGWTFNEETQLWEPPDYLIAESDEKWRWDAKKQIWIDKQEAATIERYHEYRKSQGKGPTYEEWKAAREAEQNKDKSTN